MKSESTREQDVFNEHEAMAAFEITRVPVDYFHYRHYRYTNLKDAVAQAERDRLTPAARGRTPPT